jgi:uncharacterized membrane protein YeaQ/YmgE (transglycosylase-associated protein family)
MNWLLFIILGAGCGWVSAGPLSGKKDGNLIAAMAVGAGAGLLFGWLVSVLFGFLFLLAKLLCVVFGVLIVLALLGAGKSE